jgi:hypothetical protein
MGIYTPQPSSPPQKSGMKLFVDRMIRAAKLDPRLYEEVEADKSAMIQAMGVVVLSGVARGIGFMQEPGLTDPLIATGLSLLGWYVWAFLTYIIGTRLLPEPQTQANFGELLRTIGFSNAPGMFLVLAIIPGFGKIVNLLALVWMFSTMVMAVRQALDYRSTYRAIGVCFIVWLVKEVIVGFIMVTVL